MRLRFLRAAAVLAAAFALLLPPAGAQNEIALRVGAGPVDVATPLVYAVKAGIYKRYGLNIDLIKLPTGAALAAAVAGGSLDLAQASSLAIVLAHAKGLPFTVIGNLATYDAERPDQGLVVLASSAIKAPKDLEGKTLAAVSLSDLNSLATNAWLDARGVDRSTIKYLELSAAASVAAMEQNRVVAASLYEPFLTGAQSSGKIRVLGSPYEAIARRFSSALLFGNEKWVADHHDVVERFLRASQEASLYIAAHETESAALIGEFTGVDPATLAGIRHAVRGIPISPADIQPVIDASVKYKFIDKQFLAAEMICNCALKR